MAKADLEGKEVSEIKRLGTLAPAGFNLNTGGVSGGSAKRPVLIDGILFESTAAANEYVAQTRGISVAAAARRITSGRIDIITPAKSGQSLVKTKEYKAWSAMVHGSTSPKSKDYIAGIECHSDCENLLQLGWWISDMRRQKSIGSLVRPEQLLSH